METSKDDIKSIIELIKRLMPDFVITKNDLVKIESPFVIKFYHSYLNELVKNCRTFFNHDGDYEDILDTCPRFVEPDVFLFLQTRDILNRIGVSYFTVVDFYRPANRTRLTMRVCLNFLLYIKENLPKVQGIIHDFNNEIEENARKQESIVEKKTLISELSRQVGLDQEKLCELEKEYEREKNIQVNPLDTQITLINEIQELQKQLENISIYCNSQKQKTDLLDAEIIDLKSKVVSEVEVESERETLEKVEAKIEEHRNVILKSEKLLEEKHKDLISATERTKLLQNCNISILDDIEEIYNLREKVEQAESLSEKTLSNINEKQTGLARDKQDLIQMDKRHETEINNLKISLNEADNKYDMGVQQLYIEQQLHKDLGTRIADLQKQLDASELKCAELEEEQITIQTDIQRIYQKMISAQNMITTPFNDALSGI